MAHHMGNHMIIITITIAISTITAARTYLKVVITMFQC